MKTVLPRKGPRRRLACRPMQSDSMNPSIFRAYDIRGVYGRDFTDADFEKAGNAFSRFARHIMVVGRDCRLSSPALKAAVIRGVAKAGIDVMDVGMTPRGATMFWGFKSRLPSLYVSASHLPPEWNGLKFNYADGTSWSEKDGEAVKEMVMSGKGCKAADAAGQSKAADAGLMRRKSHGRLRAPHATHREPDILGLLPESEGLGGTGTPGMVEQTPVLNEYKKFLKEKIPVMDRELRVLLDCGNGTAGLAAPDVFNEHGCEVGTLFVEPDGSFPNRQSEIKEGTLTEANKRAADYDITIAFDGDADRMALVDNKGRFVSPEVASYLIMTELLKHQKGPVTANVECSRVIDKAAAEFGRKVVRTPVGYTFVVNGLRRSRSCFGLERSMHFIIPSVMPIDDGIIAGLYAAYALSKTDGTLAGFVDAAPKMVSGRSDFVLPSDDAKFAVMEALKRDLAKRSRNASMMDGVRLDFDSGWVLVRASNTSPLIRLTAEGEGQSDFNSLMEEYGGLVREAVEKAGGKREEPSSVASPRGEGGLQAGSMKIK